MNGTTIPTGRDNTYTPAETNIDIQTGRAVFVDSDKYESDTAYKTRVDKYVAEGFHMIKDGESSGGGSGSGSEPLVVTVTEEQVQGGTRYVLDKTWQEIYDAYPNVAIYSQLENGFSKSLIGSVGYDGVEYAVNADGGVLKANSADGYPATQTTN